MNKDIKAFPIDHNSGSIKKWQGMDLRDYFAAKAMPSIIKTFENHVTTPSDVAKWCYQYADEMMKAREK